MESNNNIAHLSVVTRSAPVSKQYMDLSKLPEELIHKILATLDVQSRRRLACVSRSCRAWFPPEPQALQRLMQQYFPDALGVFRRMPYESHERLVAFAPRQIAPLHNVRQHRCRETLSLLNENSRGMITTDGAVVANLLNDHQVEYLNARSLQLVKRAPEVAIQITDMLLTGAHLAMAGAEENRPCLILEDPETGKRSALPDAPNRLIGRLEVAGSNMLLCGFRRSEGVEVNGRAFQHSGCLVDVRGGILFFGSEQCPFANSLKSCGGDEIFHSFSDEANRRQAVLKWDMRRPNRPVDSACPDLEGRGDKIHMAVRGSHLVASYFQGFKLFDFSTARRDNEEREPRHTTMQSYAPNGLWLHDDLLWHYDGPALIATRWSTQDRMVTIRGARPITSLGDRHVAPWGQQVFQIVETPRSSQMSLRRLDFADNNPSGK